MCWGFYVFNYGFTIIFIQVVSKRWNCRDAVLTGGYFKKGLRGLTSCAA
ncbi:hypothetical protein CIT292_10425 [Citrobacter youngae ATCC 29220]|uniref:Uncharacterized protein n=1 Tax=Citrobacter youngae ATCC 29220 TaxID=500640 RepID=D4BIQ8_9ENTR|nr:hypothetical protein CIT292_10425 [Citrobacter youngae ATCC 29220]